MERWNIGYLRQFSNMVTNVYENVITKMRIRLNKHYGAKEKWSPFVSREIRVREKKFARVQQQSVGATNNLP